jgi:hypothetical protein
VHNARVERYLEDVRLVSDEYVVLAHSAATASPETLKHARKQS